MLYIWVARGSLSEKQVAKRGEGATYLDMVRAIQVGARAGAKALRQHVKERGEGGWCRVSKEAKGRRGQRGGGRYAEGPVDASKEFGLYSEWDGSTGGGSEPRSCWEL